MSGILLFGHHKWSVRGRPNSTRLFERATWIRSRLPRVAQLATAIQVIFFFEEQLFLVTIFYQKLQLWQPCCQYLKGVNMTKKCARDFASSDMVTLVQPNLINHGEVHYHKAITLLTINSNCSKTTQDYNVVNVD